MRIVCLALLVLPAPALAGKKKRALEQPPPPAPVTAPVPASASEAIAYNDAIVAEQTKIGEKIAALTTAMDGSDPALMTSAHAALEAQAASAVQVVSSMPAFAGDPALRDSAVRLFDFYLRTTRGPYARLIAMLSDQAVTPEEAAEAEQLVARINEEEPSFDGPFQTAQEAFATQWGFTLE